MRLVTRTTWPCPSGPCVGPDDAAVPTFGRNAHPTSSAQSQWAPGKNAGTPARAWTLTSSRGRKTGATQVTVRITNPADEERFWEGLFLVDTGATDSLVPRLHLEAIGLEPRGRRVYELADGSDLSVDVTVAEIEFMGEVVGGTIIMGAGTTPSRCWA